MATTVKAIYEDGVFKPKEPVQLAERTEVEVLIPTPAQSRADDPTGWKAIDRLIGMGKGTPGDVSEKHDDYLYGAPRE